MHGEELVEPLGTDELAVGPGQLKPDHERLEPGDEEEEERAPAVQDADPLVVDGREPRRDATGLDTGRRVGRHRDGYRATVSSVGHA